MRKAKTQWLGSRLAAMFSGNLAGLCVFIAGLGISLARQPAADPLRPWTNYATIMWVGDTAYRQPEKLPLFFQRLREMGISTAMVFGDGDPKALLDNHFPYYVENLVNRGLCLKFNSKVMDWDKFVTGWAASGRPESLLIRDYCLDDPEWRDWARGQVRQIARKNAPHQPLAYNLRDELSTTFSANPFDYDFNPLALAKFREWLQTRYRDLSSLNNEWETKFLSWGDVKPFTTDRIKNRMAGGEPLPRGNPDWPEVQAVRFEAAAARRSTVRWNFSPWADFRTFMDLSLARTLDDLRRAAREVDPQTPVGIEGTQMPDPFGGYDLWRLSQALDWVEPYDIGNAREIFGSFMPGKPILTTVFESDTGHARRRLWHLLLEGDRGCLVWWSEDCLDWKSADYSLTPKAKALAPVLRELASPLARLFLRAERVWDPILLHYSQPSIQVDWLMESTVDGSTWLRRFSSFEAEHNRMATGRNSWLKALQDEGYSPRFVSSSQIEHGALRQPGPAALVLPGSWALSDTEVREIEEFCHEPGHLAISDGVAGQFDEHGKLRPRDPLESVLPAAAPGSACSSRKPGTGPEAAAAYASARLHPQVSSPLPGWLGRELMAVPLEISLPATARVRIHRFSSNGARLVAFERNIDYQMSEELKQAGGNEALEQPLQCEAVLARPLHVYDLRVDKYLGLLARIPFTLDPWQPALFALTTERLPGDSAVAALQK